VTSLEPVNNLQVPPKVLFALRSLVAGGVETTALTLHRHLARSDWRVFLALLEDFGDLSPQARSALGILRPRGGSRTPSQKEDLAFVLRSPPRLVGYGCRLQALLNRIRPQILFTHSGIDMLACARPLRRQAVWVAGVGSDVLRDITSKHPSLESVFRPVLGMLYRGPSRLVAVSHGLRQTLVDRLGVPAANVEVIGNPVDLEAVRLGASAALDGVPERFVLGVGRLGKVKGFDVLIRACAALDLELVLLGDGEERASLGALARDLGYTRLHLLGFEANPWRYMSRALAVAVTSRLEGFSNVTVEAMACGAPVVVTDCPHGPREIVDEGRYGTLVPVDDVAALTRALADLASPEHRDRLRTLGLQRAAAYSAPAIAAQYLDLFHRIIAR
jgi:glycosyltransferase involved in cell wall biosynthesis